jgi:hypothetical protein
MLGRPQPNGSTRILDLTVIEKPTLKMLAQEGFKNRISVSLLTASRPKTRDTLCEDSPRKQEDNLTPGDSVL